MVGVWIVLVVVFEKWLERLVGREDAAQVVGLDDYFIGFSLLKGINNRSLIFVSLEVRMTLEK